MYQLRRGQPAIEIVDGPMAGRKFRPGVQYAEVPPGEMHRFEALRAPASPGLIGPPVSDPGGGTGIGPEPPSKKKAAPRAEKESEQ